jgi:hypothetical protein
MKVNLESFHACDQDQMTGADDLPEEQGNLEEEEPIQDQDQPVDDGGGDENNEGDTARPDNGDGADGSGGN